MAEGNGTIASGTAGGLIAFLDFLVAKGYASNGAAGPLKSAVRQVIEIVEGKEEIDEMDVRSLDPEEYVQRFEVKARGTGRYKGDSITSYKSRFGRAMEYYDDYLTSGKTPTFRGAGSSGGPHRSSANRGAARPKRTAASPAAATATVPAEATPSPDIVAYPFPLQNGKLAMLRLPVRLEKTDAERLAAFIRTLVFEPQKELTRGEDDDLEPQSAQ